MSNHNIKFGIVVALAALMMLSYQSFSSHVLTGLASSSGNMITQLPALDAEKAETVIQIEEGTEKIVNRSKIARSKKVRMDPSFGKRCLAHQYQPFSQ